MWARVMEIMFGAWLMMSPFVFAADPDEGFVDRNAMICGALVMIFALASYAPALRRIHLFTLLIAIWMIGVAYSDSLPQSRVQNQVTVGILLLMTAVIPSWSHHPPKAWTEFLKRKETGDI